MSRFDPQHRCEILIRHLPNKIGMSAEEPAVAFVRPQSDEFVHAVFHAKIMRLDDARPQLPERLVRSIEIEEFFFSKQQDFRIGDRLQIFFDRNTPYKPRQRGAKRFLQRNPACDFAIL